MWCSPLGEATRAVRTREISDHLMALGQAPGATLDNPLTPVIHDKMPGRTPMINIMEYTIRAAPMINIWSIQIRLY